MATQKEVAEYAGVSFITVSRVINKVGNVRESTRLRVEEAIRTLNYHPNSLARALNRGLAHTLGLVVPRMYDLPLFNNFYVMGLLSGIEMRGRTLGWDILLTTDYDQDDEFDFLRIWHQRKVDGLIFVGLNRFPQEQIEEIEAGGIPCVSISDRIASPAVSWIDTDNHAAARDAVGRLAGLGHTRLCFVGVNPARDYNPNFRDRQEAALAEAAARGLPMTVLSQSSSQPATGVMAARDYLGLVPRPTGVVVGNDSIAMSFVEELSRHGLACPRDFSVVGFDAEPAGRVFAPSLASFRQPLIDMGQEAVQVLVNRLGGQLERQTRIFPCSFQDGASLGRVGG